MNRIKKIKVTGMNSDLTRRALRLVLDREEVFVLAGGIGGSTAIGREIKVWSDGDVLLHDRADQDQDGPSTFMADFGPDGSEVFAYEVLCDLAFVPRKWSWDKDREAVEARIQELLDDPRVEILETETPAREQDTLLGNLRVPVIFATWNRMAKEEAAYYSKEEFLAAIREAGVGVDTLEHVEEMSRDWLSTQTGWSYMELPEDAFVIWREALTTPPETPEEPKEGDQMYEFLMREEASKTALYYSNEAVKHAQGNCEAHKVALEKHNKWAQNSERPTSEWAEDDIAYAEASGTLKRWFATR